MPPSPTKALKTFRAALPEKARIYVGGCSGEPLAIADAFKAEPELASGLTFLGVWIPGVNTTDWASLHASARAETIFLSPALRESFERGDTAFLPLSYVQAYRWLETTPLDAAIIMVSPPDEAGEVSLGISADFPLAPLGRSGVRCLALINPAMPSPPNSPRIPLSRFDIVCEAETPLAGLEVKTLPPVFEALGRNLAALVDDGDMIQLGLGNVQQAVLGALGRHKNLRLHAGMISTPITDLLNGDVFADAPDAITTGVALGTPDFYKLAATARNIRYRPVAETHAITTLAKIPNLKAINSVIEVDLFGQANAEFISSKQVSGTGGLVDFLRGAALSRGGLPITALASTARSGTLSRIVPRLPANATSIARADMGLVVTEHGTADLRHASIDTRAERLIAIAAPQFRDALANDWEKTRSAM